MPTLTDYDSDRKERDDQLGKAADRMFEDHPDLRELAGKHSSGRPDNHTEESLSSNELIGAENDDDIELEPEESTERSALQDRTEIQGDLYKGGGEGNIIRRFRRRRALIMGTIGLLLPVPFLVFALVFSGPLKLIQIGKMFENFHMGANKLSTNSTFGRFMEFSGTARDPSKRNVSYLAEKITNRMQESMAKQGLTIDYGDPNGRNTRRMQSIQIDTNTPEGRRAFDALNKDGFDMGDVGPDGKATLSFRDGSNRNSARLRRRALNISIEAQGKGKISSAISKRLLRLRAGVDFHPLKNIRRDASESFLDWRDKRKRERNNNLQNGAEGPGAELRGGEETTTDENGNAQTDVPDENADIAEDGNTISGRIRETADSIDPGGRVKAKFDIVDELKQKLINNPANKAGPAAAVVGLLCMVKSVGDEIPAFAHANQIMPMVRLGYSFVATASQIQGFMLGIAPPPSLDELRMLSEEVDGVPIPEGVESNPFAVANSKPFTSAQTIEANQGIAGGYPAPDDLDVSDSGEKSAIFRALDKVPGLGTACGVIDKVTGTAGKVIKKIPIFGSVYNKIEEAQSWVVNQGLQAAFGKSQDEVFMSLIGFISGGSVDVSVLAGANLGSAADKGVFLGEKEAASAMGGTKVTKTAYEEVRQEEYEIAQLTTEPKSFFARILDVRDPDSLLAQAVMKAPGTRYDDGVLSNLASYATTAVSSFGSISLSQKAHAQGVVQSPDYGVSPSGFTLEELEDERYADPYANADIIEPQLAQLNERYSGCFGTKIDPNTFALTIEESPDYSKTSDDKCFQGGDTLVRYRMYLLQSYTARSIACYEGLDDQACIELGIEGSGKDALNNTAPTEDDLPDYTTTAACPSSPGISDAGIFEVVVGSEIKTFRGCKVTGGGIFNTVYADNFNTMFVEAAKAGFNLTAGGGSYLSPSGAIARWQDRCGDRPYELGFANPPCNSVQTAPPGRSNHEKGLAADLHCPNGSLLGGGTTTRAALRKNDPCLKWVLDNSPTWGLIHQCARVRADGTQSDSCESWHISPNGK